MVAIGCLTLIIVTALFHFTLLSDRLCYKLSIIFIFLDREKYQTSGNKFLPKRVCTNVFIKVSDDIAISNFNIRELMTAVGNVHYEKQ